MVVPNNRRVIFPSFIVFSGGKTMGSKRKKAVLLFCMILAIFCQGMAAFILPSLVTKKITSSFGECRNSLDLTYTRFHTGIDVSTNGMENTNVLASEAGVLWKVWVNDEVYGNAIFLKHENQIATVYGHLNRFSDRFLPVIQSAMIEFGEATSMEIIFDSNEFTIRKGEVIGLSGQTGASLAPHCHFEMIDLKTNETINPIPYLRDLIEAPIADLKIEKVRIDGESQNIVENGTYYYSTSLPKIEINSRLSNRTGQGKYGVKSVTLFVNEIEFFKITFDRISETITENGDLVFGEGSNHSNYWYKMYATVLEKPIIINQWKETTNFSDNAQCRVVVEDDWGATKIWNFRLRKR